MDMKEKKITHKKVAYNDNSHLKYIQYTYMLWK